MPFDSAGFRIAAPPKAERRRGVSAFLARAWRIAFFAAPPEPPEIAVLRVLEEARGLIEEPQDWVQGRYQTMRGERCAIGALRASAALLALPEAGDAAHRLLAEAATAQGFRAVEAMNDHSRHGAVLEAFDRAIAAARQRIATRFGDYSAD
jgi:hypothetical protein